LDSRASPTLLQVILKQCKNDQFRTGNQIFLGKTFQAVCPVEALVKYLSMRGSTQGPLPNKKALTRAYKSFKELKMDPHQFNTHSFRIGAVTSAKRAGVSDSHLKALGRLKSDAYLKYVRMSPQDLARLSKSLASS